MDYLREDERLDDLQFKGLKILQNPRKFCFGTDAVLLANFADIRKGDAVVDLGTGTGIIPIILAGREENARIHGIDIQDDMVEMAQRSIELNNLSPRVCISADDIRGCYNTLGEGLYSLVVSNPPYKKIGSGIVNPESSKAIARHEILCTLDDVLDTAYRLLKVGGRFAMVHQAERLAEILVKMHNKKLEPKRIRLVHPNLRKAPNIVLIEAVKNGKPFLKWLPPLFIYDMDGNFTDEYKRIYHITSQGEETFQGGGYGEE